MAKRIDSTDGYLDDYKRQLEAMVNRIGLSSVLSLLETICDERAENESPLMEAAMNWKADARILEAASASVTK